MDAIRRGLTVIGCVFLLAACQEDGPSPSVSSESVPNLLSDAQQDCVRSGGRWALAPSKSGYACFRNLSDAGKLCSVEGDCQGLCLARSRTCSPIEPFFGCHEVLSNSGVRQTLCIE